MLAIYLDPANPTNVVEAWRFGFIYPVGPDGLARPRLEVRDKDERLVTGHISAPPSPNSVTRSAQFILKS